jgi:hypothetical protein
MENMENNYQQYLIQLQEEEEYLNYLNELSNLRSETLSQESDNEIPNNDESLSEFFIDDIVQFKQCEKYTEISFINKLELFIKNNQPSKLGIFAENSKRVFDNDLANNCYIVERQSKNIKYVQIIFWNIKYNLVIEKDKIVEIKFF